ncbi:hypothetical protein CAP48_11540 [Advenella sp. S44]|uniref:hypothetical protein n=1 Tax=Advenella sp. S44 TaxID=1982755 RepID=UPI000C2A90D8|nr:hypothetical protein [Advenella sp. S44]PJX24130.1 hypothetical protein CAP48_11540 [Advenella sp. S44]
MKDTTDTINLYDAFQWNVKVIDHHVDEVTPSSSWDQDGVHRILVSDGNSIDLRLQNHSLLRERSSLRERVLLVEFIGNLERRDEQKDPFSFGLDVAERLQLPVLAVAEPTISKSKGLCVGWYTGNENMPKTIEIIGTWLNKLARHYSARLVLFGGSAGGFGALSVLPYMTEHTSCLVWNPQTCIAKCEKKFVISYLKNAFPTRNSELNINQEISQEELATRLVCEGIYYDLQRNFQIPSFVKLLFLQNDTDRQFASHAKPFLENLGFTIHADNLVNDRVDDLFVKFGTFGDKHNAPDKEIIEASLTWLIDDLGTSTDLAFSEKQRNTSVDLTFAEKQSTNVTQEETFEVTATLENSTLLASIHAAPAVFINPVFAFYLFIDGKRTSIKQYSSENSTLFEVNGHPKKIEIVGYVLDNGKRKSKKINVDISAE